MCKRIIWGNSICALLKKWIIIGPLYEIQVNVFNCMYIVINVFICMYIVIGDHIKEGDVIILDINNYINYS